MKDKKILFATRNNGADSFFRASAPASLMRFNGMSVTVGNLSLDDAQQFDVLILQGHCDLAAEVVARDFKDAGKPVIYDVDDYLFGITPSIDFYSQYRRRGIGDPTLALAIHERLLRLADLVTVPTWELSSRLKTYNKNVKVLPNCILQADWDTLSPLKKATEGPIIGWFGLPSHWDTWRIIAEPVEKAIKDVGGTLCILGFPEVIAAFPPELTARTRVQPLVTWRKFEAFRRMIKTFDVGICYVEDTPFNRCKSPLRALQYGAAGVPIVASKSVYGEILDHENPGQHALIVDSPMSLHFAIKNTIEYRDPAQRRAAAWRQEVLERHTYEMRWEWWGEAIEGVLRMNGISL
ncbi:MAG: hypothetical protein DRP52_01110 [Planctomycetota bacterium]|nr:MAG: hypothetical protein DRP52_01110 [Planctomycetota bacterium]